MEKIEIKKTTDPYFEAFWEIYEYSFPFCEIRSKEEQKRIFGYENYFLEAWIENGVMIGFIGWWICDDLRYVEHFAINSQFRSLGYGNAILSEWMKRSEVPVILEIEPIVDELTTRRRDFYLRLGYVENDFYHWHPPYHRGLNMDNVELRILTYPHKVKEQVYQTFLKIQRSDIIPMS